MIRRQRNRYLRKSELPTQYAGTAVTQIIPSNVRAPERLVIPSWTSSGGRFYYDLVHGLGREEIIFQLYDLHVMSALWPDDAVPQSETTLRIWLSTDPGASRVSVLYL